PRRVRCCNVKAPDPVTSNSRKAAVPPAALGATVTPAEPPSMVMAVLTAKADRPSGAAGAVVVRLIVAVARAGAQAIRSGPGGAAALLAFRTAWRRAPGPLSPGSVTVKTAGACRSSSASTCKRVRRRRGTGRREEKRGHMTSLLPARGWSGPRRPEEGTGALGG